MVWEIRWQTSTLALTTITTACMRRILIRIRTGIMLSAQWEVWAAATHGGWVLMAIPPSYLFSQTDFDQNGGTNISAGQAVPANFTGVINNYISGNVQFDGTNVVGVGVSASATISGAGFNTSVDTDGSEALFSPWRRRWTSI